MLYELCLNKAVTETTNLIHRKVEWKEICQEANSGYNLVVNFNYIFLFFCISYIFNSTYAL